MLFLSRCPDVLSLPLRRRPGVLTTLRDGIEVEGVAQNQLVFSGESKFDGVWAWSALAVEFEVVIVDEFDGGLDIEANEFVCLDEFLAVKNEVEKESLHGSPSFEKQGAPNIHTTTDAELPQNLLRKGISEIVERDQNVRHELLGACRRVPKKLIEANEVSLFVGAANFSLEFLQ